MTLNEQLEDAIIDGDMNRIESAIVDGADVNYDDGYPLFLAILNSDVDAVKLLRSKGAFCKDLGVMPKRDSVEDAN